MSRKVLVVIGQLETGGTERHLLSVLPALNEGDFEISVYVMRGGGALEGAVQAAGVNVVSPAHHSRRWLGLARTAVHFRSTLRKMRPDILHFFLPEAYLLGGYCSFFGPDCVRMMSRRSLNYYQDKWPFAAMLERFLHRRMQLVVANSRAVADQLRDEGVPPARLEIIYNGVVEPSAEILTKHSVSRTGLGVPDAACVIAVVANLIEYKGHADVINALQIAQGAITGPWVVLMIGRGPLRAELQRLAESAGISANVLWLDSVDEVQPYLAIADMAVLASHEEGFSNALLESMAAGRPVIATAVGGNVEAVVEEETGLLVPQKNPQRLSEAILRLTSDAERRETMGRAGRERAAREFSMARCVEAYRRLYNADAGQSAAPLQDVINTHD